MVSNELVVILAQSNFDRTNTMRNEPLATIVTQSIVRAYSCDSVAALGRCGACWSSVTSWGAQLLARIRWVRSEKTKTKLSLPAKGFAFFAREFKCVSNLTRNNRSQRAILC